MLLFVSPSNPTGAVYPPEQVGEIGEWAAAHGLWVVTDEIYEHLVYGDAVFSSIPVQAPEIADTCVVLNGVAKTYAMTGWRVGWMIGPKDVISAAANLQSHATSNVCNVAQAAALAAVSGDLSAVAEMRAAFDRRRQTMARMLNEIPGVICPEPQGAFYCYPSVKGLLGKEIAGQRPQTSAELAGLILDEAEVAVVPGEAFGTPGYFRLSCALGDADLEEGISRMAKLLADPVSTAHGRCTTLRMAAGAAALPKAHLHLHFTGSMRHGTLVELAAQRGIRLPPALTEDWPPRLSGTDERGWFRFQRLYDTARSVLRTPGRRAAAADRDRAGRAGRGLGAGWRSRSTRPGTPRRFGGITAMIELVLDAAAAAARGHRGRDRRHRGGQPDQAPAGGQDPGPAGRPVRGRGVTGFGLSNDERRGAARDFAAAFRIAERAGLLLVPHGGELAGPASVEACLDDLHADRIGHGIRAAEDPAVVKRLAAEGSPARCARPPTSRSASRRPRRRSRCGAWSRRACRSRSAPTTRCCSARG